MNEAPVLVLNGKEVRVDGVAAMTTLLDWLRENPQLRGTKEGCAEGDCGACTVVTERLGPDGAIRREAINACLTMVGQLDGLGVRTVEGLASPDGDLHPVQSAFVDTGGSQCGFCTPGFIMASYAFAGSGAPAELALIHDALAGNLCRCTGYRPIVDAVASVTPLENDPVDEASPDLASALAAVSRTATVCFAHEDRRFHVPRSLADAATLRAEHPQALLLCGGTDLGLRVSRQRERLPQIIHLAKVPELNVLDDRGDHFVIGAAVTYSAAFELLTRQMPTLRTYLTRLGSLQIRNMGTIGGNIGTASPIGDSLPMLLALDASIRLYSAARGRRDVPAAAFFLAYRRTALAEDELIEAIILPKPAKDALFFVDKISKRRDQDISSLCGAYRLRLDNGVVSDIRLVFGGLAATTKRAAKAEAVLLGKKLTEDAVEAAVASLPEDFQPLSDWRATGDYRLMVAGNLLRRLRLRIAEPSLLLEVDAL